MMTNSKPGIQSYNKDKNDLTELFKYYILKILLQYTEKFIDKYFL